MCLSKDVKPLVDLNPYSWYLHTISNSLDQKLNGRLNVLWKQQILVVDEITSLKLLHRAE